MNKRRLIKLADLLEADAKNKKGIKFDIGTVAEPFDFQKPFDGPVALDCGTTACAMGLACISGAFKRAGLSYNIFQFSIEPAFKGCQGFDCSAMGLFEISEAESDFLFMPNHYPPGKRTGATGERYVAKRIRDFVAGKVSP